MKKERGITLIALVITIIILLILAGVAISSLTENGLFEKAKLAKEKQAEAEVKEKINLMVSEYAIERELGKSLLQFLTEKKDNGEIADFVDNNDGTFDIIIDGYKTTINESDLSTTEPVISSDIMVTLSAKEFVENKIQAVITVKSQSAGIKEIRLLNDVIVQGNNKNTISFDQIIEANTEYQVEIELTNGTTTTKPIKYEDTEAPTATIEIPTKIFFKSGIITANVKLSDNRSGVNISSCKWVVVANSGNLGTEDESLYTGTFTNTTDTITTEEITEEGEYYIHLLLKDNVGNTTEVISEKVEIKDGYAISTPEELQAMRTDLAGNYYVVNDINMAGFEFTPIEGTFAGTLDGQGYTISNLTITNNSGSYTGIFKGANGATFKNILFKDVNITSNSYGVGVLAGRATADQTVKNVGITGNLSANQYIGSFFGSVIGASSNSNRTFAFENCYARTILTNASKCETGGLVGYAFKDISFTNCYWSGTMNGTSFVGTLRANGLSGNQDTTKYPMTVNDCYYNSDLFTLSVPASISGTGLTTDKFADSSNFTNWDFKQNDDDTEYTWYIDTETGYPELYFKK